MRALFVFVLFFWGYQLVLAQDFWEHNLPDALQRDKVRLYINQNRYEAALPIINQLLEHTPKTSPYTTDLLYQKNYCKLKLEIPFSEKDMEKFLEEYPETPHANEIYFLLGSYYFSAKKYPRCIYYLSQVDLSMLSDADKLECNFRTGYAYMNLKEFDKAGVAFQRIKQSKNKYTYAANYYLGYVFYKKELYEASESHLKKAFENISYKQAVPPLLAQVYNKQKKYDTLITFAEKILNEDQTTYPEMYVLLAEAYFQKNKFDKCIEVFNKCKQKQVELSGSSTLKFGIANYKTGNFENSIQILKNSAEINDSIGQYSAYYLGLNWLRLKNKPFAFNAFNQARKMKNIAELTTLATIEYCKTGLELGNYDLVIGACKEYISTNSSHDKQTLAQINELLSEAYLHTNDYNSVIKYAESQKNRSAQLNKIYQLASFYKAIDFFNDSKFEDALENLDRSLQNDYDKETTALAFYYSAECQSALKDYAAAIENYQKVLKMTAKVNASVSALTLYGLGYAYYNSQEYALAAATFRNYLDLGVQNLPPIQVCDAYVRMADAYYATKKWKDAAASYQKAIDKNCTFADYSYYQLGMVLHAMSKDKEAKSAFRQVWDKMPNSLYAPDALYNDALIDFENTNYQEAIQLFTVFLEKNKTSTLRPLALQKRAIAYFNKKQYDLSAKDYTTILNEYPTHKIASDAILGLQEALSASNKHQTFDSLVADYKLQNPNDVNLEKAEIENAKNLYASQKYQEAIGKLENVISKYPKNASLYNLLYILAESYYRTGDYLQAETTFQKIIDSKSDQYTSKSILRKAEMYFETKDFEQSATWYRILESYTTSKKEVNTAHNGLMMCYYELKDYDSCAYFAQKVLDSEVSVPMQKSRSTLYLGKCAQQNDDPKTPDYFIACINNFRDIYAAESNYLLAQWYRNQSNYQTSNELLFSLIKNFSNYSRWYGKSFLLLADNYISLNETYQAKATLLSIVENSRDNELIYQAKEKLSKFDTP